MRCFPIAVTPLLGTAAPVGFKRPTDGAPKRRPTNDLDKLVLPFGSKVHIDKCCAAPDSVASQFSPTSPQLTVNYPLRLGSALSPGYNRKRTEGFGGGER
jgi:hypothetical protein